MDIEKEALPQKFYLVICSHVLEHLKDPRKALDNLKQMVQPGGILFLAVPDGRIDDFPGHIHYWGETGWRVLLQQVFPSKKMELGKTRDDKNLYAVIYL